MDRIKDTFEFESKTMNRTVKFALTLVLVGFVLTMSPSSSSTFNLIKSATAVSASTSTNANVIAESKFLDDFFDALNMSLKGYK
jgi:hypothetical protein